MADVGPDLRLTIAKMELDISQQQHNVKAAAYRLLQLDAERERIVGNIAAHEDKVRELQAALEDLKAQLAGKGE